MKRYLIAVIIISVLFSGLLLSCDSKSASTETPTSEELQSEVETLRSELEQLKKQEKAKILKQAEVYYAIVQWGSASSQVTIHANPIAQMLGASGQFWGLIQATEDPYLLSICKPEGEEVKVVTCSYSHVRDYAEGKYRELMSKYYSQQYIDDQLALLEKPTETVEEEVEEKAIVNTLPFTYTGKGNGRTPAFTGGGSDVQCKVTFTTTWDGDISISWYREELEFAGLNPRSITIQVWRSTGISLDFPKRVEANKTYEYIFDWNKSREPVFLGIVNVPVDGEWTITVSQTDVVIPKPQLDITVVVEYEGECRYQVTTTRWGSFWRTGSGNTSRVYENIGLPFHCRAIKEDAVTGTLVLQFLYNGQVVAQDAAIGEDDEAWVYWEGPK